MSGRTRSWSPVLLLIVALPLVSVALGVTLFYLALSVDVAAPVAQPLEKQQQPLSKTSWRGGDAP